MFSAAGNPLLDTAGELLYDAFPARVTGKLAIQTASVLCGTVPIPLIHST